MNCTRCKKELDGWRVTTKNGVNYCYDCIDIKVLYNKKTIVVNDGIADE